MAISVRITGTVSVDGGAPRPAVMTGVVETLGFWGGVAPPHPDNSLPGPQPIPTPPIFYPPGIWGPNDPRPSHPIVIVPPGAIDGEHPAHPIFLPVYPAHPIELPPEVPAEPGFQWVYTQEFGWVLDPIGGGKPQPVP